MYIEREALINEINLQKKSSKTSFPKRSFVVGDVLTCIYTAPAADVAPVVHGKWERSIYAEDFYRCSECSSVWPRTSKFCPNCGAKMDGGADA